MSLKSKFPSYPKTKPARVINSLAKGGCTSTKYWDLMYFEANLPKWTSSKLHIGIQLQESFFHEVCTHTTLFGCGRRNNRTKTATTTMMNNTFHSAGAIFSPPGGKLFRPISLLVNPFDAASLRASASR